jgi:hypothetical protein
MALTGAVTAPCSSRSAAMEARTGRTPRLAPCCVAVFGAGAAALLGCVSSAAAAVTLWPAAAAAAAAAAALSAAV